MLGIDIGNSNVTFARLLEGAVAERVSLPIDSLDPARIRDAATRIADGTGAWIASVVPSATEILRNALAETSVGPVTVLADPEVILPHTLTTPETTGIDRLLAARAARDLFDKDRRGVIVVQLGSAVTVDWVNPEGVFEGGMILPGPALWLHGLQNAARLPRLESESVDWDVSDPCGDNTTDAIRFGLAAGLPGAVRGAVQALRGANEEEAKTVVTGGWAETLRPHLQIDATLAPDLVLRGIALVGAQTG